MNPNQEQQNNLNETQSESFSVRHGELFCITPLSKYLALILFIILPFIGGYVGYVSAPEKVVEVERVVLYESQGAEKQNQQVGEEVLKEESGGYEVDLVVNLGASDIFEHLCGLGEDSDGSYTCYGIRDSVSESVLIEDLNLLAREQQVTGRFESGDTLTGVVYVTSDKNTVYFYVGVPHSGSCCSLVSYDVTTQKFTLDERYTLSPMYPLSYFSNDGRILVTYEQDGKSLKIFDLETDQALHTYSVPSEDVTLFQCGPEPDPQVEADSKLVSYKLYEEDGELHTCNKLIETKIIDLFN